MEDNKSMFDNGNPKLMFAFGFVSGIAVVSVLVSGMFLSGSGDGGLRIAQADNDAAGFGDTADAGDTGDTGGTVPTTTKSAVPAVTDADHIRGNPNAKVVMIEYSDFECPFCERHHPNMLQLEEEFGDDIAWVYRHYPLSFHPDAFPAAVASECANEQGKFWEYADGLFENQALLGDDYYPELAGELGLNVSQFETCLDSGKYDDFINGQQAAGTAAGVTGTPATFINGQLVSGAVPYASLQGIVEAAL